MPEVRTMLETPDGSSGRKKPLSSRRVRLIALIGTTVAATVAVFAAVVPSASAATLFSDNFQDGDVSGWSKSGGEWAVVTDGTLALRQSKLDSELAREFAGSTSWTNYSVQARVKPLAFDGAEPLRRYRRPGIRFDDLLPAGPAQHQPGGAAGGQQRLGHRARRGLARP